MKLDKPINNNYCATVVAIKNIVPLENCDNVVGTTIFGFQAIVQKDIQIGELGIVFPAETQLSDEYCYHNNLYRHGDKNHNESKKGYIEDNRRVRAVKFRGNRSDCLFMPLESLAYTGVKVADLKEGEEFDHLNGKEICRKYVIAVREPRTNKQHKEKKFIRVDTKFMPEHFDTDNFFKYGPTLDPETFVTVTQKIHGTSIRIGNTIVKRRLNLVEKGLKLCGVKIQETEFDYVYASRKVIKDINNPYHNHFYGVDIWTEEGKKLVGLIPENYLVYAELVGWTCEGKEIQKDYTYGIETGKAELYVYRVAFVNNQGIVQDLCWDHLKEFCKASGLKVVPELWSGKLKDFNVLEFLDKRFYDAGQKQCLWLGDNQNIVDEGVVIRVDRRTPYTMKAKSPLFLEHETKILDTGMVDLESEQSQEEI